MCIKKEEFVKSLIGLKNSLEIYNSFNLETGEYNLIDTIRNGIVQKFEITSELLWKSVREFLSLKEGTVANSPKSTIKALYLSGRIEEDEYFRLLEMIDTRNIFTHVYDEEEFLKLFEKVLTYTPLLETVRKIIQ